MPLFVVLTLLVVSGAVAAAKPPEPPDMGVLADEEWRAVDRAVDRGLSWLAKSQQTDGSMPTLPVGQPGVTSLATLAFLSHGHQSGAGPYGETLRDALKYILSHQRPNGLIARFGPGGPIEPRPLDHEIAVAAALNSITFH